MGRNKIAIQKISNERNRQATFTKRKSGLIKKAMELSILCDCEIALIIFNSNNSVYQYASNDIKETLAKYEEYGEMNIELSNRDYYRVFSGRGKKRKNSDDSSDSFEESDDLETSSPKRNNKQIPTRSTLPRKSKLNTYSKNEESNEEDQEVITKGNDQDDVSQGEHAQKKSIHNSGFQNMIQQNTGNQNVNHTTSRSNNHSKYPNYPYLINQNTHLFPYYNGNLNGHNLGEDQQFESNLHQDNVMKKGGDDKTSSSLSVVIPDFKTPKSMGSPITPTSFPHFQIHSPTQSGVNLFGPYLSPTNAPNFVMFPEFYSSFITTYPHANSIDKA